MTATTTTTPRRFADALAIQQGACNPHGIARSLLGALDECRTAGFDTTATCLDPAVRLILHQLAFLCRVSEIDDRLDCYGELTRACETAKEARP